MAISPCPFNRDPLKLTPEKFERLVMVHFEEISDGDIAIEHRKVHNLECGNYEIDLTIKFRHLGLDFLVLVECKRYKNPIERDIVAILESKVRTAFRASKGVIFSTSKFRKGAVKFAERNNIALVLVTEGPEFYYSRRGGIGQLDVPEGEIRPEFWIFRRRTDGSGISAKRLLKFSCLLAKSIEA